MPSMDEYLCLQMDDQLRRLNITKLAKGRCPPPEFELVCDNSDGDLPIGMGFIYVVPKLYMLGGQKEQRITDDGTEFDYFPNLDIFVWDSDCWPSIRVCNDIPSMLGPKFSPLVVTLNGKIYVLARRPFYKYEKALEQPVFEVFDPVGRSWKALPSPPWTDPAQYKLGGDAMYHHFVWAHKIVFCTQAGFYIFDARIEKWEYTDESSSPFPIVSCAAVAFEGFLIAMPWDRQELLVYELDFDGIPKSYRVLDQLCEVFNPPFVRRYFQGFLTHLGDGDSKMCFLYAGLDDCSRWCARVAIFRVSISFNYAGDLLPDANLETLQHYDFEKLDVPARWIDYAFVMGDCSKKHDDTIFKGAYLSGLDRGDYLEKHDDASSRGAYLSGSDRGDYLEKHDDASLRGPYLSGSDRTRELDSFTTAAGGGHAVFSIVVTLLIGVIQIKFQNGDDSPFRTHAVSMSAFLISICAYSLAVVIRVFVKGQTISGIYSQVVSHVVLILKALSAVTIVSVFVPNWLNWLLYISWRIFSVMGVAWGFILLINQWLYQRTINAFLQVLEGSVILFSQWLYRRTINSFLLVLNVFTQASRRQDRWNMTVFICTSL